MPDTVTVVNATPDELFNISLESSNAHEKEVFIFEKSSLSDIISVDRAEEIRKSFLKNGVKVKQITNIPTLPKFTDNSEFVNRIMSFRYVPVEVFSIEKEIVIFDTVVAMYDSEEIVILRDKRFSKNMKQLFLSIWEQGQSPKLDFEYKPNHSFYNKLKFVINNIPVFVWPDADAKESYKGMKREDLAEYLKRILDANDYYADATYIIGFIWNLNGDKMIDVWKFNENHVDDRSGPLCDVRVYREGKQCNEVGLGSGNTLLVLGFEEKLRRQSESLKSYFEGPVPKLPLEIMNGKDFL